MKKSIPWQITITRATNGYVLEYPDELADGGYRNQFIAVEDPPSGNEAITTQALLYEICEFFSCYDHVTIRRRKKA